MISSNAVAAQGLCLHVSECGLWIGLGCIYRFMQCRSKSMSEGSATKNNSVGLTLSSTCPLFLVGSPGRVLVRRITRGLLSFHFPSSLPWLRVPAPSSFCSPERSSRAPDLLVAAPSHGAWPTPVTCSDHRRAVCFSPHVCLWRG